MSDIVYGQSISMACVQNNGNMCWPKYQELQGSNGDLFGGLQQEGEGQGISAQAVSSVFIFLLSAL